MARRKKVKPPEGYFEIERTFEPNFPVPNFCATIRAAWQQFNAGIDADGRAWIQHREPAAHPRYKYFSEDLAFIMVVCWIMKQYEETSQAEQQRTSAELQTARAESDAALG